MQDKAQAHEAIQMRSILTKTLCIAHLLIRLEILTFIQTTPDSLAIADVKHGLPGAWRSI